MFLATENIRPLQERTGCLSMDSLLAKPHCSIHSPFIHSLESNQRSLWQSKLSLFYGSPIKGLSSTVLILPYSSMTTTLLNLSPML